METKSQLQIQIEDRADVLMKDMHETVSFILHAALDTGKQIKYDDAVYVWLFQKLAWYELRIQALENYHTTFNVPFK